MVYKNNNNFDDLINQAGNKIGENPADLKKAIDSGKLDDLMRKMNPNDAQRLQQVLNDPRLAQQMLNTPQAQMLIKRFMK